MTRSPSEEVPEPAKTMAVWRSEHRNAYSTSVAILADTDTVAVQSHGYTSAGVACCHESLRDIKVLADDGHKGVVCLFVVVVGTPVHQVIYLTVAELVVQDRRVMSHDYQFRLTELVQ